MSPTIPLRNFSKSIPITKTTKLSALFSPSLSTLSSSNSDNPETLLNQILSSTQKPPEKTCHNHIRNLCLSKNLRSDNIFPTPITYNYLLTVSVTDNNYHLLTHIFKHMLTSLVSIQLDSYLIIAKAFLHPSSTSNNSTNSNNSSNSNVALLSFVKEVSEMGLERSDIVLNRFIYALAKCGNVDSALFVFDCTRKSLIKCEADLVTFNTVLAILGRLGRVEEMMNVFGGMGTRDLVTYNTVLNCLRKVGRYDLCLVYYKEMCERGVEPDLYTFKGVIESLGRSGDVEGALKVFEEMKRRRVGCSVHIYRALVFSLRKMGRSELALEMSKEMDRVCERTVVPRDFRFMKR